MKTKRYLTKQQQEYLESRDILKQIRKEKAELRKEREIERSESTFGRIKTDVRKGIGELNIKKTSKAITPVRFIQPGQQLSNEQSMLGEMFGGGDRVMFGNEEDSLPKIDGILRRGHGIMNSGDYGETGSMFGI